MFRFKVFFPAFSLAFLVVSFSTKNCNSKSDNFFEHKIEAISNYSQTAHQSFQDYVEVSYGYNSDQAKTGKFVGNTQTVKSSTVPSPVSNQTDDFKNSDMGFRDTPSSDSSANDFNKMENADVREISGDRFSGKWENENLISVSMEVAPREIGGVVEKIGELKSFKSNPANPKKIGDKPIVQSQGRVFINGKVSLNELRQLSEITGIKEIKITSSGNNEDKKELN
jgi:hypothetical protein